MKPELRALIEEMRAALEPFAKYIEGGMELDNKGQPLPDNQGLGWVYLTYADFRRARAALTAAEQSLSHHPSDEGWRTMDSAPRDGTKILAVLFRETCEDMDGIKRKAFSEVREIFYQPYTQFGMFLPWHAGDPFDSHEGLAPEHMGEAVPIAWMPREALPATPRGA